MRRFAIVYAVLVGCGMLGLWAMLLATGQVPEVETEPYRIAFHLAAEWMTAGTLIVAGVALARRAQWARATYRVAIGMLLYTAVVSPGYYAQLGQWPMVVMFAAIFAGALFAVRGAGREA